MNKRFIEKRLEQVIYPGLDKDIVSLKCVKKIEPNNEKVRIELTISNESVYEKIFIRC